MRALAVVLALVLAALGWQSWRLNNASHTIETQGAALKSKTQELTKKNSQLIGLSILTETKQPGADAALCGSGTDHRTTAQPPAPDRGIET